MTSRRLVMHFLACFGVAVGGNGDGLWLDRLARNLSARDWPGNVRQLRNEVEKLVLIHRGNLSGMVACSGPSCAERTDREPSDGVARTVRLESVCGGPRTRCHRGSRPPSDGPLSHHIAEKS